MSTVEFGIGKITRKLIRERIYEALKKEFGDFIKKQDIEYNMDIERLVDIIENRIKEDIG